MSRLGGTALSGSSASSSRHTGHKPPRDLASGCFSQAMRDAQADTARSNSRTSSSTSSGASTVSAISIRRTAPKRRRRRCTATLTAPSVSPSVAATSLYAGQIAALGQIGQQSFRVACLPRLPEFVQQSLLGPVEADCRPLAIEDALGRVVGSRLANLALGPVEVERQPRRVPTTLHTRRAFVLVDRVTLEGREKKRPETPARRVGGSDVVALQQPREEALDQVLGIFPIVSVTPQVAIEGRPVDLTERGQRLVRPRVGAGRRRRRPGSISSSRTGRPQARRPSQDLLEGTQKVERVFGSRPLLRGKRGGQTAS